jgi:hypothetical protein
MEILRVPPYETIFVEHYKVPEDNNSGAPFRVKITDMADLSIHEIVRVYEDPAPGTQLFSTLPGKYDNNYRLEVFMNDSEDPSNLVYEEYYELIRPYVDPNTLGTTASEIAEYTTLELVARSIIDTFVAEGFYNKKTTIVGTGNGSDYFPLWEKAYRVFKVYENNELVYDRSTPSENKYEYVITADKTAIQKVYVGQLNRYESTGPNLISGRGDLAYYGYEGTGFPLNYDYTIVLDQGYLTVPADIEYATKLLIEDLKCGKLDYYKRYVTAYNTDQFRIQFDKSMFDGTGNFLVDKILEKYVKTITKPGII